MSLEIICLAIMLWARNLACGCDVKQRNLLLGVVNKFDLIALSAEMSVSATAHRLIFFQGNHRILALRSGGRTKKRTLI